ncbi:MAG: ABC transporter ATP-binding protein [Actinomycetota bacterium]
MSTPTPAVSLRGITKRFPGVVANDHVDFDAAVGEVHALLGENGAGKSTLSSILTGLYRPDEGTMAVYGERVEFRSPREALEAGICMVHQHFRLVPTFTVAENVLLGDHRAEGRGLFVHPREVEQRVAELGVRYGLDVDPRARIWQLSLGEQQRVEILKALHREARVLVLDEPTAVLTPQEAEGLFATVRRMADEGRTIIFISHKLNEVTGVADTVTVLREGRTVATAPVAETTPRSLASLMVGREIEGARRVARTDEIGPVVLEVDGLRVRGDRGNEAVRGVSFSVASGEIVAVAGVAGNGQRELAEAIGGMRAFDAGSVVAAGHRLRGGNAREAIHAGIAHVPEDRLHTGVAANLSVASNVVLKSYRHRQSRRGPLLRLGAIRERAAALMERYDVRGAGPHVPARQLSGGNLQKVVLGREFSDTPAVLVAASPTRGLDVSASEAVHRYLREGAASGMGILLIGEDLDEILALSDRVLVMSGGAVVGELDPGTATREELGLLMAGAGA